MGEDIFVTRSAMPGYEEYCAEIAPLWDTRRLTNAGSIHSRLRQELGRVFGTDRIELFVNGHTALETGIRALELTGEVITTPYTFASTTHALVRNGLTPVFCDIKENDFTLDEDKVEALITPETSAILAVHVYGLPCNAYALQKIAYRHGLKLICDAAHAFGVEVSGRSIAAFGDLSMFSFHASKVFHTVEGGALVYRDSQLGEKLRLLRNFGLSEDDALVPGGNGKMNEFSAAMGICNLRHYREDIRRRGAVYAAYCRGLNGIEGIRPFACPEGAVTWNYAYYPILVDETLFRGGRDALQAALAEKRIFTRKYFYPLASDFSCYRGRGFRGDTPAARYVSGHVLCLPMYSDLEPEQADRICRLIKKTAEAGVGT